MASKKLIKTVTEYENYIKKNALSDQVLDAYVKACFAAYNEKDIIYGQQLTQRARQIIEEFVLRLTGGTMQMLEEYSFANNAKYNVISLWYQTLLLDAPYILDAYMLYVERYRAPKDRFYQPRRKTLKQVVDALQDLADDKLDELFLHMPGRVGKTQTVTEFLCWYASKHPEKSNLYCSYSDAVSGSFYDGCLEFMTDPTYAHIDVFPNFKIVGTDAKGNMLDIGRKKKYKSITAKGLISGLNGLCDCNGIEIGDDLLEGIQDALNPDILKRKQSIVDNNYIPRAKEQAKRLWMGTIWSLQDPYSDRVDFLMNDEKSQYIRYKIIKIPALNENDESNFDYDYGVGFSTEYYLQIRSKFEKNGDMASWFAQYQQEPVERDGSLFNPSSMKFYNGVLPDEEPDRIFMAVDIAYGGGDFTAGPICFQYGNEYYIPDVVFNDGDKTVTRPEIVGKIIKYRIQAVQFEANKSLEDYKDWIEEKLQLSGYKLNITSKPASSQTRKDIRIRDRAPDIREFYFLEDGKRSAEYQKFMQNVYSFKFMKKNKHDDAPDSLAMLCDMIYVTGNNNVAIFDRRMLGI
jgi:hypothetical protein